MMKKIITSASVLILLSACSEATLNSATSSNLEYKGPISYAELIKTPSPATQELVNMDPELSRGMIEVSDKVHVAVGYGASSISFIEGDDGVIVVDAGQMIDTSKEALSAYREISDKPITGIIYTHSHGDHMMGAKAFVDETNPPEVWARSNFGSETAAFRSSGITINRKRGPRQAGFKLPPEQRINNGVAPAVYPNKEAFNPESSVNPTRTISEATDIVISGVTLKLVPADGETSDQIYVYFEDEKVLFAGDNFYQSWPNLYAIRGTPYRDVKAWANAINSLREVGADVLVGGHTPPIIGAQNVEKTLTTYHDGITFVYDKTIEGINKGLTPDELVDYVKLPPELGNARELRPYYGNPEWAVRSIFNGYLGWYDGNPTNLFPLSPNEEAERIIALAGGKEAVTQNMVKALEDKDDQWALQLADYLLAIDSNDELAMKVKADAMTRLAEQQVTTLARNYYLTTAQELRAKVAAINAP